MEKAVTRSKNVFEDEADPRVLAAEQIKGLKVKKKNALYRTMGPLVRQMERYILLSL